MSRKSNYFFLSFLYIKYLLSHKIRSIKKQLILLLNNTVYVVQNIFFRTDDESIHYSDFTCIQPNNWWKYTLQWFHLYST